MQRKQSNILQAMRLVRRFLKDNAAKLGAILESGARRRFEEAFTTLENHMKAQNAHQRDVAAAVIARGAGTITLVRGHMRPITAVASLVLPGGTEMTPFKTPGRNCNVGDLLAAAYGMAKAAEGNRDALVSGGLAATFITDLVAATDALQASVEAKGTSRSLKVEATAGLQKDARVVRRAVRALDALITAQLGDDDVLLDRWKNVRRVVSTSKAPAENEEVSMESPEEVDGATPRVIAA